MRAVKYLGPVGLGVTSPQLFRGDDGKVYVVKLQNNRLGPKVLVNELIACRMGEKMGICFPPGGPILIEEELLRHCHRLWTHGVRPGLHFACLLLSGARYVGRADVYRAVNKQQMAGVMLFDHMFHNLDRTWNRKNILVRREADGYRLYAIDNSHLFRRGRWDAEALARLSDSIIINHRRSYGLLLKHFLRREDFAPYLAAVTELTEDDLRAMVSDVPGEWLPDAAEREALIAFLQHRCRKAGEIVDRLTALIANINRRADADKRK